MTAWLARWAGVSIAGDGRQSDAATHRRFPLPPFRPPGHEFRLVFEGVITDVAAGTPEPPAGYVLLVQPLAPDGEKLGEQQKHRFVLDREPARIVLPITLPIGTARVQVSIYQSRERRERFEIAGVHAITPAGIERLTGGGWRKLACGIERSWRQSGRSCVLKTSVGTFCAEMPAGWSLRAVHPAALAVAEFFLFAQIEHNLFGLSLYDDVFRTAMERMSGPETLLAFSAGEDSTAAAALLPNGTVKYLCARSYTRFRTASGHYAPLAPTDAINRAARAVPNTIVVPNDFETIGVKLGMAHGYRHNFGYAAIGTLLADHLNAGVLAFGSVMEQVFMGSGNNYIDVAALKTSRNNRLKSVLAKAGLFFALPTGGCSEVITNRIAREGRYPGLAVSCPNADADGAPCGRCFKCFRKTRLDGSGSAEPDAGTLKLLAKYPLKSATSVVYAAQRSGYCHPAVDRYKNEDLSFLERYHDNAIRHFVPGHLQGHVREELQRCGVAPMSAEDERRLRSVGRVFWPEQFDPQLAGLAR